MIGYDAAIALALGDPEMQVTERGDLRQMGDDDHLVIFRQRPERLTDDLTRSPADTDIDLVKDQRRRLIGLREDRFQRQHQSRRLTAGRDPAERFQSFAGVRRDEKRDTIHAGRVDQKSPLVTIRASNRNAAASSTLIERNGELGRRPC